jgi:hypothetical protein
MDNIRYLERIFMARNRKRPYVAIHTDGTHEILNLKYAPSAELLRTSSTTVEIVAGPFKTWEAASNYLAYSLNIRQNPF